MLNIIKKASIVFLALLVALGWIWTGVLKERGYIDDDARFWILMFLTFSLFLQQVYLVLPKPIDRRVINERREISENYVQGFWSKYCQILKEIDGAAELPPVRISVMLPTKRLRGLLGSHLEVYYHIFFSEEFPYLGEQLSVKWRKGYGVCGAAWKSKFISFYDSEDKQFKTSAYKLSKTQLKATQNIVSIVSIPIKYEKHIVGVINVDSNKNISQTKFNNPKVYLEAAKFAKVIAPQFDKNGVSA